MSNIYDIRSYLPNKVNDSLGYYCGMVKQVSQLYLPEEYNVYHIIDNVYIGDLASSINIEKLKKDNFTHILSVMNGSFSMFPEKFTYKQIHINDNEWVTIDKYFEECNDFIIDSQKENGNILVHCMYGMSRSATIVLAYLIKKKSMAYENAIAFVREKKPNIHPNVGFIKQLKKYQIKK